MSLPSALKTPSDARFERPRDVEPVHFGEAGDLLAVALHRDVDGIVAAEGPPVVGERVALQDPVARVGRDRSARDGTRVARDVDRVDEVRRHREVRVGTGNEGIDEDFGAVVFFKARDADTLTAAFKDYSAKLVQKEKRPSVLERLQQFKALAAELVPGKMREKKQERAGR